MPSYYIYLISSLPMLHFGTTPPISSGEFLEVCEDTISAEDLKLIKRALSFTCYDYTGINQVMRRFRDFERALRNELVRIRSSRRHIDPSRYLREKDEPDISIKHAAINAYRAKTPLESEKILDRARWDALGTIEAGHYFDITALVVYACRLSILEKWAAVDAANNAETLQTLFEKG